MEYSNYIIIGVLVLALILFAIILISSISKAKKKEFKETGKYPKGHYLGLSIACCIPIGIVFGLPIGMLMKNFSFGLSIGPSLGLTLGVVLGIYLEKKHEYKLRPLTPKELKRNKYGLYIGLGIVVIGVIALSALMIFNKYF